MKVLSGTLSGACRLIPRCLMTYGDSLPNSRRLLANICHELIESCHFVIEISQIARFFPVYIFFCSAIWPPDYPPATSGCSSGRLPPTGVFPQVAAIITLLMPEPIPNSPNREAGWK